MHQETWLLEPAPPLAVASGRGAFLDLAQNSGRSHTTTVYVQSKQAVSTNSQHKSGTESWGESLEPRGVYLLLIGS